MSDSLVETIQQKLGFPELQKIDPNTQEVNKPENFTPQDYLPQAAIPVVLLGLYKFSGKKAGNAAIVNGNIQGDLLDVIFGKEKDAVVARVAGYTENTTELTSVKMQEITKEALNVIRQNLKDKTSDSAVKNFLLNHRNSILQYLPPALQIGKVLRDDTIDDRTHKMEGPMSDHMHWLEKFFPSTDRKKEENW